MLDAVTSYLPVLLRLLIINEESLLAFCCFCHGDLTQLPTVMFILSVVLYSLENPGLRLRLPDSLNHGSFKALTRFIELAIHWIITNVVISCWHLFYSLLCSFFTSVVKEVEEPTWLMGLYWKSTVTKPEATRNTFFPTLIGTLITGCMITTIFFPGSRERIRIRRGL